MALCAAAVGDPRSIYSLVKFAWDSMTLSDRMKSDSSAALKHHHRIHFDCTLLETLLDLIGNVGMRGAGAVVGGRW